MLITTVVLFFCLGTILGSFGSAIIYRLKTADSNIWHGRSLCPNCQKTLQAKSLIPILSYIYQKGSCLNCQKPIPKFYLINEICAGLLFAHLGYQLLSPTSSLTSTGSIAFTILIFFLVFTGYLITIFDARYQLIPDIFSYTFIVLAFASGLFINENIYEQIFGSIIAGGFFTLQFFLSKGRMIGSGDIFLGIGLGLLLGIENSIVALMLSYIGGSIWGIGLILGKKANRKSAIAFGPFLMLGTYLSLNYGQDLYNWFTTFYFF